ncbi:MAG: hypothetical protein ACFN4H_07435, partial [Prevotella sp.]
RRTSIRRSWYECYGGRRNTRTTTAVCSCDGRRTTCITAAVLSALWREVVFNAQKLPVDNA